MDEAYLSFVGAPWDSLALLGRDHVVLVRSMTKDYAQTGLRLGFALAAPHVVDILRAFQPDWSVNSLAQSAGIAALADDDYLPRAREAVFRAKDYLIGELAALGFAVLPSEANFLLVEVGDAAACRARLLTKGIVVRNCASFGLPQYIRLGIRRLPDCMPNDWWNRCATCWNQPDRRPAKPKAREPFSFRTGTGSYGLTRHPCSGPGKTALPRPPMPRRR